MGQMTVYCQNLTLGALSSHSALSMLVGALFKKSGLFLKKRRILLLPVRAEEICVVVSFGTVICDVSVYNILSTAFSNSAAHVSSPFQTTYRQTDDTDYHTNRYHQVFQCHVLIFIDCRL
jgi:hypothetical protein